MVKFEKILKYKHLIISLIAAIIYASIFSTAFNIKVVLTVFVLSFIVFYLPVLLKKIDPRIKAIGVLATIGAFFFVLYLIGIKINIFSIGMGLVIFLSFITRIDIFTLIQHINPEIVGSVFLGLMTIITGYYLYKAFKTK